MEVNTAEVDGAMSWILQTHGVSMQFGLRDTMRVLCNNLVGMTFPKSNMEGKRAIDKDTDKIFAALDSPEALGFFNQEFGDGSYTKAGKVKGKKRQSRARKILPGVKFNWQGDQAAMRMHHQEHRNNKGKVVRSPGKTKRGQWEFLRGMYVTKTAMRKYRKSLYKSIGKVKAGWAPAAEYFAAKTQGRLVEPAFVRKQFKNGSYKDQVTKDGNGSLTAINNVHYASRMTKFFFQSAVMKTNAYSNNATQKQIEKIVARFNGMTGKAPTVQVIKP